MTRRGADAASKAPAPRKPAGRPRDARLQEHLGYVMKRVYSQIHSDAMRVLEPLGLRVSTYSALAVIADNPGLRQSQIAEELSIERSNAVLIIDALEEPGWITRNRVPTDRRSYALEATLAGRQVLERATEALKAHEARFFAGVEPAVLDQFAETLQQIARSAEEGEENP